MASHRFETRTLGGLFPACCRARCHDCVTEEAGRHHYPTSITTLDLIERDDLELWVTDPDSDDTAAVVVPVARRGAGVVKVQVLYATPGRPRLKGSPKLNHIAKPWSSTLTMPSRLGVISRP
ncbi:MAG: DUF6424 family protein [Actinomycetota bacterium]|nr:DUF6424 family protein [Actinomycetota bacterium]